MVGTCVLPDIGESSIANGLRCLLLVRMRSLPEERWALGQAENARVLRLPMRRTSSGGKTLSEWQLKVAEKQLAGNSCLVEAVQVLMDALDCTSLGGVLAHGGQVGAGPCRRKRRGWTWGAAQGKAMRMMRMMQMVKRRVLRAER